MRILDLVPAAADAVRSAGEKLNDLLTPTLRLGVTGLARSGKTVLITAMVRNLVSGGRLPFFAPYAEGRILGAWLEPQPDDSVPRFDYEGHIGLLSADPPDWPDSTRRISELRVTISYRPQRSLLRALGGTHRLHLDIVDYPGEWLIDLALLEQDFATWSAEALCLAREGSRADAAAPFLGFLDGLSDEDTGQPEQTAISGARLFTAYLAGARAKDNAVSVLGPGRFLMPGDLEGSPLLTFFPLADPAAARPELAALLARRFESYKTTVVKPFFRDHFSRLDRQVVLVDALGALNAGPAALGELERALEAVLRAFKPRAGSWLASLLGLRRLDRLLFAATKADHLHHASHDRLEALLQLLTDRAASRAAGAGAQVKVMAMAALRATREGSARDGGDELPVIFGTPLPGERLGRKRFDGRTEVGVFPGDLPVDPRQALEAGRGDEGDEDVRVIRFRPPRLAATGADGIDKPAPHIRLDSALEFLLGDQLS